MVSVHTTALNMSVHIWFLTVIFIYGEASENMPERQEATIGEKYPILSATFMKVPTVDSTPVI